MKKIMSLPFVFLLTAVLLFVACAPSQPSPTTPAQMKPVVWRTQTSQTAANEQVIVMQEWAQKLSDYTKGAFQLQIAYSQGLGYSAADQSKAVSLGHFELAEDSGATISARWPWANVLELPSLTRDKDPKAMQAIANATFDIVEQELLKDNLVLLLWMPLGLGRGFDFAKPPPNQDPTAPLKGLKVRTSSNMVAWAAKTLGATPVDVDMSELTTALQRGVVDGHDFGPYIASTIRLKVAELSPWKYNMQFGDTCWVWYANKSAFEALPKDVQQKMKEYSRWAMSVMTEAKQKGQFDAWPEARDKYKAQYIEPLPQSLTYIESQAAEYYKDWLAKAMPIGQTLLDKTRAAAKQYYEQKK